jgi:hypothetical protein
MYSNVIFPKNPWFMVMFATSVIRMSILVHPPSDDNFSISGVCAPFQMDVGTLQLGLQ